jgi:succinoglycan biosynthesis protein ExoO
MSQVPEISVVMANYNGQRFLEEAIKSLQDQTFRSWELIVVDDASPDCSAALAENISNTDPRVTVIRQLTNRGPAAARNRAIELARGQWIAIFDNDDLMLPTRLEVLRDRARHDQAEIVADNLMVFTEDVLSAKAFLPRHLSLEPRSITLAEFIDSNRLYSRSPDLGYLKPLISTALIRETGISYDEELRIGEDYDFMARLLARGAVIRFEPSALYLYRKHDQSLSHRIGGEQLAALIRADERLAKLIDGGDAAEHHALKKRRQTLDSMLTFDRVVSLIKSGRYVEAAGISARTPYIWPLLARPVRARFHRMRAVRPTVGATAPTMEQS